MKKILIIFAILIVIIASIVTYNITFGLYYREPITSNVIVNNLDNSHHELKNMKKAKALLINYFKEKYKGCILKTISYEESADIYLNGIYNKDKYHDIIVLRALVKTDKLQENLEPNSKVELDFIIGKKNETVDYHVLEVKVVK